jgi:hypothetical protein
MLLNNYQQYIVCKDIFLRFATQFAKGKMTDFEFFQYHRDLMRDEPEMTNYTCQFALTSCFGRTDYNRRDIEAIFDNKIKIQDTYGLNGDACDISTFNSAVIVDHMYRKTSFKDITITILNPPLEYGTSTYKNVQNQEPVKTLIEKSKMQTGQTNNDILIGDRSYDIKHTQKTSSVNHVHPWIYERIEKQSNSYFDNLIKSLTDNPNDIAQQLKQYIYTIQNNNMLTQIQKVNLVNEYLASNWSNIEKYNILIPLIIPMTTKPFVPKMPKTYHEKLHLTPNVTENHYEARLAIIKSIPIRYKNRAADIFATAREMTEGLIDSTPNLSSLNDVD